MPWSAASADSSGRTSCAPGSEGSESPEEALEGLKGSASRCAMGAASGCEASWASEAAARGSDVRRAGDWLRSLRLRARRLSGFAGGWAMPKVS